MQVSLKELQRWARTNDFADRISWGEVEARIMAEPAPSAEELATAARNAPADGPMATLVQSLAAAPLVVPTFGSPVVGLVFVVAFVVFDKELPSDWGIVVQLFFGGALLLALFTLYTWLESRRRGWENLGVSGLTAVASLVSALLLATSDRALMGVWPSVFWMATIIAVVSVLTFLFFLVLGKSAPKQDGGERRREIAPEEHWLRNQRAVVLEQLVRRDLLNDADLPTMITMPPGTWLQLESLPDGRVVRHG